jgi:solute carrier family 35 (UDP-galactose transporter), member B1
MLASLLTTKMSVSKSNGCATNGAAANGSQSGVRPHSKALVAFQFLLCVAMIYAAYITQGRVSELLSKERYGEQQVRFERMDALVGFQCIACFIWAALLGLLAERGAKRWEMPPVKDYALIGITNVVGPVCGVYALKNISYPAQVLAKSCKSVPIMFVGALLYAKKYKTLEYVSALAIGGGVGLFAILSGKKKAGVFDQNPALGYALVLVNLIFDSFTNTGQDEIKRSYPKTSSLNMMCWTNFWGGLYYAVYFFLLSSTGMEVISFCIEHPAAAQQLAAFCLCGALGQLAIFYSISQFGSLVTSIVCTTRKFFSILISVVLTGATLTLGQWAAVTLVFAGLLYKSSIRLFPSKAAKVKAV